MAPKLYLDELSGPARSVLMTAATLGIELKKVHLDIVKGDQLSEEFIKINPQHTVPTLDDDGYILSNSHAINAYLVDKYGKDDSLYPKDLKKRGVVNQRLFFNEGIFFHALLGVAEPIFYDGVKEVLQDRIELALKSYDLLNTFLTNSSWVAGDQVTFADYNIANTLVAIDYLVPLDKEKYPRVQEWVERVTKLPCYKVAEAGFQKYKNALDGLLAK